MKLKSNILTGFTPKAICILFIMFFSVGLFAAKAFASGCYGDENCFNCSELGHRHATGAEAGSMPHGCQPNAQSSSCDLENSRIFDRQYFFVSTLRLDNHNSKNITATTIDKHKDDHVSKGFTSPIHSSVLSGLPPIYLLNLSLLC